MLSEAAATVDVESKIGVMVAISVVSLLAVSFPTLSKQVPCLHIPPILFFIGKHFGTGVILATAFLHLLDDAFRSLRNPVLEIKYGRIGKWTGLVILGSLLTIFLIEYASTTFVEHLRNKPSTPLTSAQPSPKLCSCVDTNTHSPSNHLQISQPISVSSISENTPLLLAPQVILNPSAPSTTHASFPTSVRGTSRPNKSFTTNTLTTPATSVPHSRSRTHSPSTLLPDDTHRHPLIRTHHTHHVALPKQLTLPVVDFIEVLTNSPRICRLGLAGEHQHHHHQHERERHGEDDGLSCGRLSRCHSAIDEEGHDQHHIDGVVSPGIGRKRQIVSILVLQLGIMIHSLVIGLTLAVATGSDFTSLTTAIMFHQLFEGLSLGIRIAALPPPKTAHSDDIRADCDNGVLPSEGTSSQTTLNTKNNSRLSSFSSSHHHRGARNRCIWHRWKDIHWLKPTLSFLFAVTTPAGMISGILAFGPGQRKDAASMLLIQGVMSAISAGMLIYAATVEMIAGDFVFGDVDGGHHHHHHEPHADEGHAHNDDNDLAHLVDETGVHKRGRSHRNGQVAEAEVQRQENGENGIHVQPPSSPLVDEGGEDHPDSTSKTKQASLAKRVLAIVSLLLGVVMMILVGIGE